MYMETPGLVLRTVDYKETDRILTVLTPQAGLLTVKARGCRRKNSPLAAATQLLVYARMELFDHRERHTLRDAALLVLCYGGMLALTHVREEKR